ncbi:hypothetical protein AURDEDRAFT_176995 [Auricularia subglabra TFB-10046 SS5]|uniref:Retrotransposon gag domain-containing protein n=1 Tax=Auricularia subglabra (strain TFB-10046 / SS5) TaxID=717982 RepID=J0D5C4_AURST|nr:hypothetical protein AURDEDRAFT_176995 [Auricularia subglabra TFB-10046 SS5]
MKSCSSQTTGEDEPKKSDSPQPPEPPGPPGPSGPPGPPDEPVGDDEEERKLEVPDAPKGGSAQPADQRRSASVLADGNVSPAYLPKVKDLPTFHARQRDDVDDWISQISTIHEQLGVDENKACALLPQQQLKTWKDCATELRTTFRSANYESAKIHELRMRTWRPGESFANYFNARTRLQHIVFGEVADEKILVLDVLSGLPPILQGVIKSTLGRNDSSLTELHRVLLDLVLKGSLDSSRSLVSANLIEVDKETGKPVLSGEMVDDRVSDIDEGSDYLEEYDDYEPSEAAYDDDGEYFAETMSHFA